jgi:hypothetical protein
LEQFNQNKAVNQLCFLNNKQEKIFNFKNIFFLNFSLKNKTANLYNYLSNLSNLKNAEDIILRNRFFKKNLSNVDLLSVNKPLSTFESNLLLNTKLNNDVTTVHKDSFNNYIVLKQKRYTRKKNILPVAANQKNSSVKIYNKPYLLKNNIIKNNDLDATIFYKLLKKNKTKSEVSSVLLSKRLLRTRKTLVLPSHINITVITNSYDVIHS